MGSATEAEPALNEACLPRTVEGAGGVEGTLPKRQEQRRWERGLGVVFIDALRRNPESEEE